MEGRVTCLSPENNSGVSGVNSDAAESNTIEITGDHVFKRKKIKGLHTAPVVSSKCPQAPTLKFYWRLDYLQHVCSLNVHWIHQKRKSEQTEECTTLPSPNSLIKLNAPNFTHRYEFPKSVFLILWYTSYAIPFKGTTLITVLTYNVISCTAECFFAIFLEINLFHHLIFKVFIKYLVFD